MGESLLVVKVVRIGLTRVWISIFWSEFCQCQSEFNSGNKDQRVAFVKCTNHFVVSVQRGLSFSLSTLFENLTSFQVFLAWSDVVRGECCTLWSALFKTWMKVWGPGGYTHTRYSRWLFQSQVKEHGVWRDAVGSIHLNLEERLNSSLLASFPFPYQKVDFHA